MSKRKSFIAALVLVFVLPAMLGACKKQPPPRENLTARAAEGREIYGRKCLGCHKVDGVGGDKGPDLSNIGAGRDGDWLDRFLENPQAVDPDNKMKAVFLKPDERRAVVEYMRALK